MVEATLPGSSDASAAVARGSRARRLLVVTLVVLAAVTTLLGGVALYARQEITDQAAFADRAVDGVHRPAVQRIVARELTIQLLEPALPDAIAARPAIESAVALVIASKPFAGVIRLAAEHGQRLLFERHGGNAFIILTDYYNRGDVIGAVNTLNGVERQKPARTTAVAPVR